MTAAEVTKIHDSITHIYGSSCASLSRKSTLTYEIGERKSDGLLYLRIVGNTGRGTWSKGWVCSKRIDGVVVNQDILTGKALHNLQEGKSRNTGGFLLAALLSMGLVRKRSARFYEHISGANFKNVLANILKEERG